MTESNGDKWYEKTAFSFMLAVSVFGGLMLVCGIFFAVYATLGLLAVAIGVSGAWGILGPVGMIVITVIIYLGTRDD